MTEVKKELELSGKPINKEAIKATEASPTIKEETSPEKKEIIELNEIELLLVQEARRLEAKKKTEVENKEKINKKRDDILNGVYKDSRKIRPAESSDGIRLTDLLEDFKEILKTTKYGKTISIEIIADPLRNSDDVNLFFYLKNRIYMKNSVPQAQISFDGRLSNSGMMRVWVRTFGNSGVAVERSTAPNPFFGGEMDTLTIITPNETLASYDYMRDLGNALAGK
jgi:hypothetical protein